MLCRIKGLSKCLVKSDKQKGIFYLKSTLKEVDFFEKCKNEIRVSFSIRYFVIQPYIFMLIKQMAQLQFCLDKPDKLQVMFYFPEIK